MDPDREITAIRQSVGGDSIERAIAPNCGEKTQALLIRRLEAKNRLDSNRGDTQARCQPRHLPSDDVISGSVEFQA
ncbi:MAG: hypothetical protein BWY63_00852 [Chloroflexi bacterium ADurb.Bin360]|nr:MAG: hypothetical protein BWY63_00852 [Chloroflexi bacterium ADurb.Bin360]